MNCSKALQLLATNSGFPDSRLESAFNWRTVEDTYERVCLDTLMRAFGITEKSFALKVRRAIGKSLSLIPKKNEVTFRTDWAMALILGRNDLAAGSSIREKRVARLIKRWTAKSPAYNDKALATIERNFHLVHRKPIYEQILRMSEMVDQLRPGEVAKELPLQIKKAIELIEKGS